MSAPRKTKKVRKFLRLMEKRFGRPFNPIKKPILDQIVFYHLITAAGNVKAKKLLKILMEEYVDWNEVRVSPLGQLGDTVKRFEVPIEIAPVIKGFLQQIYYEHNSLNIDYLKTETIEYIRKYFQKIDGFYPGTVPYLLIINCGLFQVPTEIPVKRVGERLALLSRNSTKGKMKKTFRAIVPEKDVLKYFMLTLEHARVYCTPDSPKCATCPMEKDCDFASKKRIQEERRKERGERKKKVKGRKTADKPAAQKKKKKKRRLTRRSKRIKKVKA